MFCAGEWRWLGWVAGAGLLLGPGQSSGQSAVQAGRVDGPATAQAVLVEMAARAGVIFAGQVEEITRSDAKGYVDVTFHVDVPMRGVRAVGSGEYVVREWAGLWTGVDRYGVGRRYLMLLLPKGASGLSGPVDGMDGAIPLMGTADGASGGLLGVTGMGVDLRWIEARVVRKMAAPVRPLSISPTGRSGLEKPIVVPGQSGAGQRWSGAVAPLAEAGVAGMKVSDVVTLLQVGSGAAHEAR